MSILAFLYLQNNKTDKAAVLLKALKVLYPDDVNIRRSLGYALIQADAAADGLTEVEACLARMRNKGPARAGLLFLRSRALWKLGRHEEARAAFRDACAAS